MPDQPPPLKYLTPSQVCPLQVCSWLAIATTTLLLPSPTMAQLPLEADTTLGLESSVVIPAPGFPGNFLITGGAERGNQLFHSFREFNVNAGRRVGFANPAGIDTILTRVTGANPSNILGELRVFGEANLFLLNPNGIIFGDNAQLNLRGSFLATTAEGFIFSDGSSFSAVNPQPPSSLLNINVPIGLQYGATSGAISSQARLTLQPGRSLILAGGEINLSNSVLRTFEGRIELVALNEPSTVGLLVNGNGLSLNIPPTSLRHDILLQDRSLLDARTNTDGGDIVIHSRNLDISRGSQLLVSIGEGLGNVESQVGDIVIDATGTVSLAGLQSRIGNEVLIGATGNAGNIQIQANALTVQDGAEISTSTLGNGNAGRIQITASDRVTLNNNSNLLSRVQLGAVGDAGSIELVTTVLDINNSSLGASTNGRGNAGNINIIASDRVTFSDTGTARSQVNPNGIGNSGNIEIATRELQVLSNSLLTVGTLGIGDAGNIVLTASDRIFLDQGTILSAVGANAIGNGGTITVNAQELQVTNASELTASTDGVGDAGNIFFDVGNRVLISENSNIFSRVQFGAEGNGGNINISTSELEVNNSGLGASTNGRGNAGSINILASDRVTFTNRGIALSQVNPAGIGDSGSITVTTAELQVLDNAGLTVATLGIGNAGNITLEVSDRIILDRGTILSAVFANAVGNGGNITVTTRELQAVRGSEFIASTSGVGDAGNVDLNVSDRITLNNVSGIFSRVDTGAFGTGGDITINTRILDMVNGGITTSTSGTGDAGNVTVNAGDRVTITAPSAILSRVNPNAIGNSGNIEITTQNFRLLDGGRLIASTRGNGNAGSVVVEASDRILLSGTSENDRTRSSISTVVGSEAVGDGGRIRLSARILQLLNGAGLSATTSGDGNAGSIVFRIQEGIRLAGFSSTGLTSSIVSRSTDDSTGTGGTIDIRTTQFLIADAAIMDASTDTPQPGGNIVVTADQFAAEGGGQVVTSTTGAGIAGTIQLNIRDLILLEGTDPTLAQRLERFGRENVENQVIDQTVPSGLFAISDRNATGDGGSIFIDPQVMILRDGARIAVDSRGAGDGGDIQIQAGNFTLDNSLISATSRGTGTGGDITITTPHLNLTHQTRITTETRSSDGGNIILNTADTLILRNNSRISTEAGTAQSGGNGGDIFIDNANGFIIAVPRENSDIIANAFEGSGGNIDITTQAIYGLEFRPELTPLSDITASSQFGIDGTVVINTPGVDPTQGLIELPGSVVDASDQVGQVCPTGPGASEQLGRFVITGRGGIPHSPQDVFSSDRIETPWVEPEADMEHLQGHGTSDGTGALPIPVSLPEAPLIEAQRWIVGEQGDVHLIADATQPTTISAEATIICP